MILSFIVALAASSNAADTPSRCATHASGAAYADQHANAYRDVPGSVTCSPTALAMALTDGCGREHETVARLRERIREFGGDPSYERSAELVMELARVIDWPAAVAARPTFFPHPADWAAWASATYGTKIDKDPNAQLYIASLVWGVDNDSSELYAHVHTRGEWQPVMDALAQGAKVTAQGAWTNGGHVVHVVSADEHGIVVNDPNGMWVGGAYLRNGEPMSNATTREASWAEEARLRAHRSPEVSAHVDALLDGGDVNGFAAWGQHNFYRWSEVAAIPVGTWVNVLWTR